MSFDKLSYHKGDALSLPKGWEIKKLGEVVDIINGRNQSAVISDNGQYPIYGSAGNLMGYATDFLCVEGTTIIGRKGNISNPIYIEEKFWNVDTAFGLYPKNGFDSKFINYLCQTIDFKSRNRGTTIPSLVKSDLLMIDVPFISSLPEQQRIVSILDEAFAAIAKAKANAEQNLKNAKELFESYLNGVFENGNWEKKELRDVAVHSLGKMLDKNKNKGEPKKYLRNQNVRWFEFDLSDLNEMPFLENEREKYTAIKGDLMICEGGYPGRAAIWEEDYPIYFQKAIHRVRFRNQEYNKWLLFYLYILDKTEKLKSHFTGTGIQHFTGDALGKLRIPLPPLNQILTIVRQLDALRAETQKLEAVYQKKLDDLEELKKSILRKAFAGELKTVNRSALYSVHSEEIFDIAAEPQVSYSKK